MTREQWLELVDAERDDLDAQAAIEKPPGDVDAARERLRAIWRRLGWVQ